MKIEQLNINECELIKHIDRSDNVRAAWQINKDGKRSIDFHYLDINGYGSKINNCIEVLQNVINQGGNVYGAYENNKFVGIASILSNLGNDKNISILVSIDVSFGYRRKGIGKALLDMCVKQAHESECDTLLVAANPYEGTIKFLKSYGFIYTQKPQNKLIIPEHICFPKFEFPPPFGGNVEKIVYLELLLNEYKDKNFFYNRTTIEEINLLNCYGATRLTITDSQSFTFGFNPVYFMATYKYEFGENHQILLACFDTFPVGIIGYGSDDAKSVNIEPMMVDSSFQQKRISLRMLELFEQRAKDLKYEEITLGHRTDNIAAGKSYEKAGFILTKVDGLSSSRHKIL